MKLSSQMSHYLMRLSKNSGEWIPAGTANALLRRGLIRTKDLGPGAYINRYEITEQGRKVAEEL